MCKDIINVMPVEVHTHTQNRKRERPRARERDSELVWHILLLFVVVLYRPLNVFIFMDIGPSARAVCVKCIKPPVDVDKSIKNNFN